MKEFLKKAFPFLSVAATAVGGPIGTAAASVLGAVIGKDVKPEKLEEELGNLVMSEEGRLKAAEAEQKFALEMQRLNYTHAEELERTLSADRDSARKREMTVKDLVPKVLAYLIVGGFFGTVFSLLFGFARVDGALGGALIGYVSAKAEQVVAYYFGSSAGSAEKTKLLSNSNGNDNGQK